MKCTCLESKTVEGSHVAQVGDIMENKSEDIMSHSELKRLEAMRREVYYLDGSGFVHRMCSTMACWVGSITRSSSSVIQQYNNINYMITEIDR